MPPTFLQKFQALRRYHALSKQRTPPYAPLPDDFDPRIKPEEIRIIAGELQSAGLIKLVCGDKTVSPRGYYKLPVSPLGQITPRGRLMARPGLLLTTAALFSLCWLAGQFASGVGQGIWSLFGG